MPLAVLAPSSCPACGADRPDDPAAGPATPCAQCATSPALGAHEPSPVGTVIRLGLRRRLAPCLDADAARADLTYLLPDGATVRRSRSRAATVAPVVAVQGLRSDAGVLFAHALAARAADPRVPWPREPVERAACAAARRDTDTSRRAALDLLDLGAPELLGSLDLPEAAGPVASCCATTCRSASRATGPAWSTSPAPCVPSSTTAGSGTAAPTAPRTTPGSPRSSNASGPRWPRSSGRRGSSAAAVSANLRESSNSIAARVDGSE